MRHVRLELTANGREGEIHPMYDLLANADCVSTARTMHWNVSGDELGIMHHVDGDLPEFEAAIDTIDGVHDYDITRVDEGSFYAYLMCVVTEPASQLFGALTLGRLVVSFPIEWAPDGTVSVAVIGSSEDIQAALDGIPDPVECTVREIGGIEQASEIAESVLTDRQRDAVVTALELGYYDIPRSASISDVATRLDCAKSTAAEHLRKSETKLLSSIFGVVA